MRTIPLKFKLPDGTTLILPDGARQLCGYDITGDEVYEGDKVWRVLNVHEATPDKIAVDVDDYYFLDETAYIGTGTAGQLHYSIRKLDGGFFKEFLLQDGKTNDVRRYILNIKKGKPVYGTYLYVEGDNIGTIP